MANSINPTANVATMDHILQRLNMGLGFDGYVKDDYIQYMQDKTHKLQKLTINPIHKTEPNFIEIYASRKQYIPLRQKIWGSRQVRYEQQPIFLEYKNIRHKAIDAVGLKASMIVGGFVKVEKDGDIYYVAVSVTRDSKSNTYLEMEGDITYYGGVGLYIGNTKVNIYDYKLEPQKREQIVFTRKEWNVVGTTAFELPSWADQNIYIEISGGWMLQNGPGRGAKEVYRDGILLGIV